jgi:hypothetical protein
LVPPGLEWLDEPIAGRAEYTLLPEGEPLPYFPPHLLDCVCFLGYIDQTETERVAGSAFWVCRAATDELRHELKFAYLVTAAHVIDDIKNKSPIGDESVRVCVNSREGGREWIKTYIGSWKTHPDPAVDIAVMKFGPGKQFDHICWETHAFVGAKEHTDYRIELADEVCFPGLFWPHKGKTRNLPIARLGNIACLRGEKVVTALGEADAYLVEARSIGGLSGSPVFIDLWSSRREFHIEKDEQGLSTPRLKPSPSSFRLLGVMQGHFTAPDSEPHEELKDWEKINMGIAIVTPAEKILEVVPQFMTEETLEIEQHEKRKRSYAVPDSVPSPTGEMQKTAQGMDIPVPSTEQFFGDLEKVSRKKD